MVKKIVTSVRIDPKDKKRADELDIKYSEAFEKGLKWMLAIKGKDKAKKKILIEQKNKVKRLKDQIKLESNLFKSLNEIKTEYNEIADLRDKIKNNKRMNELVNDYMDEVIKLKAMELNIPSDNLKGEFIEFLSENK